MLETALVLNLKSHMEVLLITSALKDTSLLTIVQSNISIARIIACGLRHLMLAQVSYSTGKYDNKLLNSEVITIFSSHIVF